MYIEEPNCEAMFTKDDSLIFKFDEDEENTMPSFVGLPAFEKKELLTETSLLDKDKRLDVNVSALRLEIEATLSVTWMIGF